MNPIIILPPDAMSEDNIKLLRDNGICAVVAADPSKVKFFDPIPAQSSRTEIEDAAIQLSRKLLAGEVYGGEAPANFAKVYVQCLVKGTPLDPKGTPQEQEKAIFDQAKREEITRLAQQEAREEAAARKAAKTKKP